MTVYVESNFVLELTIGQEQAPATEAILAGAERREYSFAIPWFSLAEPFSTVTKRSRDRKQFIGQVRRQLRDLQRSPNRETLIETLRSGTDLLEQIDTAEQEGLVDIATRILNAAMVLPVDAQGFGQAIEYQTRFGFSIQDALVFSAVVGHLSSEASPGPHYFATRDQDDFQDREIAAELHGHDCDVVLSFQALAVILEARQSR